MGIIDEYLKLAMEQNASDLHITVAVPPMVRVNGQLRALEGVEPLTPEKTHEIAISMLTPEQEKALESNGQVDFSYVIPRQGRFRVNVFKQRRSYSAALRILVQELSFTSQLLSLSSPRRDNVGIE